MKHPIGYLKKESRKTILLLCDDIRLHSGVANIAREIVIGTAHRYNWYNLGAAVKHPDEGNVFDVSEDVNNTLGIKDASVQIEGSTGYGTKEVVQKLVQNITPDIILFFTDPRYFADIFENIGTVKQDAKVFYLNIWDAPPAPMYNKKYYEACDALLAISKQTLNLNRIVLGESVKDKVLEYLPHGINQDTFKPINDEKKIKDMKLQLFEGKEVDFVVFWNSRNIQRKVPGTVMLAYKQFCDLIGEEAAKRCALVLHTQPVNKTGTDLTAVREALCSEEQYNVFFSGTKVNQAQLNLLYNIADVTMLISSNEGWGLSITESMMAGTPIIANVTGGMQDQMRFVDEDGKWIDFDEEFQSNHKARYTEHGDWAKPVFPSNISLVGSVPTPYIYDDRCAPEDVAEAIKYWYEMDSTERRKKGKLGRKWVTSKESGMSAKNMNNNFINIVDTTFNKLSK
mgnify:CR=1 FL=1